MRKQAQHWFLFSMGILTFVVGAIAILIPLIPTVPFWLISAYCFSKTSPKFRNWLVNHKIFGPPILQWEAHQVIRPKQKAMAVTMICISLSLSLYFLEIPLSAKLGASGTCIAVIIYILTRNSRAPE